MGVRVSSELERSSKPHLTCSLSDSSILVRAKFFERSSANIIARCQINCARFAVRRTFLPSALCRRRPLCSVVFHIPAWSLNRVRCFGKSAASLRKFHSTCLQIFFFRFWCFGLGYSYIFLRKLFL